MRMTDSAFPDMLVCYEAELMWVPASWRVVHVVFSTQNHPMYWQGGLPTKVICVNAQSTNRCVDEGQPTLTFAQWSTTIACLWFVLCQTNPGYRVWNCLEQNPSDVPMIIVLQFWHVSNSRVWQPRYAQQFHGQLYVKLEPSLQTHRRTRHGSTRCFPMTVCCTVCLGTADVPDATELHGIPCHHLL